MNVHQTISAKSRFIALAIPVLLFALIWPKMYYPSLLGEPPMTLGTWEQVFVPVPYTLFSVDFVSGEDGWAVGTDGQIIRWNGEAWTSYPSPVKVGLNGIEMISPDNGWAVGGVGTILHWNGQAWTIQQSPTDYHLIGLAFLSPELGWIVGGKEIDITMWDRVILQWDGKQWQKIPAPVSQPLNWELTSIAMSSEKDGWALGATSILHWDGVSWQEYSNDFDDLRAVAVLDAQNAWIVGEDLGKNEGIVLHWDGTEWVRFYSAKFGLRSISMVAPDFGWAVGGNFEDTRGGSVILHWNGEEWTEVPSFTTLPLSFVWAPSHRDGWILAGGDNINTGFEGAVFRYVTQPIITPAQSDTTSATPTKTPLATLVRTSPIPTLTDSQTPVLEKPGSTTTRNVNVWLIAIALFALLAGIIVLTFRRQRSPKA